MSNAADSLGRPLRRKENEESQGGMSSEARIRVLETEVSRLSAQIERIVQGLQFERGLVGSSTA